MRVCLIAVVLVLISIGTARAQHDQHSANHIVPGCVDFIQGIGREPFLAGVCAGTVDTLTWSHGGRLICRPAEATTGQVVRVVVTFIQARPARMHESFVFLAMDALTEAWPCKR